MKFSYALLIAAALTTTPAARADNVSDVLAQIPAKNVLAESTLAAKLIAGSAMSFANRAGLSWRS